MPLKNGWLAKNPVPNVKHHKAECRTTKCQTVADLETIAHDFLKALDDGPLAVAVSGGSDSLGVLHLLHSENFNKRQLICLTVDHQLRKGSAQEAQFVAEFCKERGLEHHILQWDGPKPAAGIQSKARQARYELLANACEDLGAIGLVTGHNLDDQFETVTMRHARQPVRDIRSNDQENVLAPEGERERGLNGLNLGHSGMAPATLFFGRMWVLRPFLTARKSAIRNALEKDCIDWIDDPSNQDSRFERVRVRQSGQLHDDLSALEDAQQYRTKLADRAARYIRDHCDVSNGLRASFRIVPSKDDVGDKVADELARLRALVAIIDVIGGRARYLSAKQLFMLRAFSTSEGANNAANSRPMKLNIGRTLLTRNGSEIVIVREKRGFETLDIAPQTSAIWDGRFNIHNIHPSEYVTVAYDEQSQDGAPCFRRAEAVASCSLEDVDGAKALKVNRYINRFDAVLPSFDLTLANRLSLALKKAPFKALPMHEFYASSCD